MELFWVGKQLQEKKRASAFESISQSFNVDLDFDLGDSSSLYHLCLLQVIYLFGMAKPKSTTAGCIAMQTTGLFVILKLTYIETSTHHIDKNGPLTLLLL